VKYLTGLTTEEIEAKACGSLAEPTEYPSTLLKVVRVSTGILIDKVSL
jgi:hypothetical protein